MDVGNHVRIKITRMDQSIITSGVVMVTSERTGKRCGIMTKNSLYSLSIYDQAEDLGPLHG